MESQHSARNRTGLADHGRLCGKPHDARSLLAGLQHSEVHPRPIDGRQCGCAPSPCAVLQPLSVLADRYGANYTPLLVSVDKRFSRNFSLQVAYTFSKALGDQDSVLTNSGGSTDPFNRHNDYGPLSFDVTHAWVMSWVWNVPSGSWNRGFKGALVRNWQVNGIWTMYSGTPVLITSSVDRALYGLPNRPDRIGDPRLDTSRPRQEQIAQYFNTSAYAPNRPGVFGNAPRADSQLRNPGSATTNLGVFKSFWGIRESHKLQFRSEFFNIFNRPNFGAVSSNLDGACFGCLTSAAEGRLIQFALNTFFKPDLGVGNCSEG